jgi:DNA polymerase I-like protein with 3'-5' exonuclease and polymerase domains
MISFLRRFGIAVLHDPHHRVLDLCLGIASAEFLVTHDRRLLVLAKDHRRIVLLRYGDEPKVVTSETIISMFGVTADLLPAFLALTDGLGPTVLTKREAMAVLERPGDLAEKIADLSLFSSRQIRNKLAKNGTLILDRLKQLSPSACCSCSDGTNLEVDIDNDLNVQLLATHAFHSLSRLLPRPAKVHILSEQAKRSPKAYHAIVTLENLQRLVTELGTSKCCAVDTESSGKDPHTAELFGISISFKKGEAFYVPTIERDLKGIDRNAVVAALRRVLEGPIKVVGHNLKYDYLLLRKTGIKIANIEFDTMLAAYDCFGDSDFLNLQFLAKRLLFRTIKAHRDVVCANQDLLDVPFRDLIDYACEHAEVTLQLSEILRQELAQRALDHQYRNETLPMVKILGDWEFDGIPVDYGRLCSVRQSLADQVSRTKKAAVDAVGCRFNPDSEEEVSAVLRIDPVLAKVIGFRKISGRVLEELAASHSIARLLVKHNRCQKRLRDVEAVIQSVQHGRVHPVFSQTRTDHCRLSSVKPRLLDPDNGPYLGPCLPDGLRQFCPDAGGALGILADAAADNVLQSDVLATKGSCCFQNFPPLNDGDHFQLLLSVVTGVSDHELCRIFLMDRSAIAAIRHDLKIRYSSTFLWLEQFCNKTATNGFASAPGHRRYLDGLRSSNLEKRNKAVNSAVKWLIEW